MLKIGVGPSSSHTLGPWRAAERFVRELKECGKFDRITETIGYSPYFKTKIFLYNSITDMQQSNVGVSDNSFDVGGQTNFSKSHVEIAHPGTIVGLREELVLRLSQLIVNLKVKFL